MTRRIIGTLALALALALFGGRLAAQDCPSPDSQADFIRGDANNDGRVSISDAHAALLSLFWGDPLMTCEAAADVDDSGRTNLTDTIVLAHRLVEGTAFPAPTVVPGPDPTPNDPYCHSCDAYGGGAPLEVAGAKLSILDARAPGGDERFGSIIIGFSSPVDIAALSGSVDVEDVPIGNLAVESIDPFLGTPRFLDPVDLTTGSSQTGVAKLRGGRIHFGYLRPFVNDRIPIPAGTDVPVLEIQVCVVDGTPAGEYPLELSTGELADAETGRAIPPLLVSGTFVVESDVETGGECYQGPQPVDCPEPAGDPGDLQARFELGDVAVAPGETFDLPMIVSANAEAQGIAVSIDYDESALSCLDGAPWYRKPDATPYGFWTFRCVDTDDTPGSGGVDEGYFLALAVFSFLDNCNNIPANVETEFLRLRMAVRDGAEAGQSVVRFLDGARADGGDAVENCLTAFGVCVSPETADSFVFVNGAVEILPDGSVFVRGDSNGDGVLDLSDASKTLGYLFLGDERLLCTDAADANDDGRLDISDPVATLGHLFLGTGDLPPPNAPGADPTPDALGCFVGRTE